MAQVIYPFFLDILDDSVPTNNVSSDFKLIIFFRRYNGKPLVIDYQRNAAAILNTNGKSPFLAVVLKV